MTVNDESHKNPNRINCDLIEHNNAKIAKGPTFLQEVFCYKHSRAQPNPKFLSTLNLHCSIALLLGNQIKLVRQFNWNIQRYIQHSQFSLLNEYISGCFLFYYNSYKLIFIHINEKIFFPVVSQFPNYCIQIQRVKTQYCSAQGQILGKTPSLHWVPAFNNFCRYDNLAQMMALPSFSPEIIQPQALTCAFQNRVSKWPQNSRGKNSQRHLPLRERIRY